MVIEDFTPEELRHFVEEGEGFQIAIVAIYSHLIEGVGKAAAKLHEQFEQDGYRVLLLDRRQKPRELFEIVEFLRIPHRLVVSGRALSQGYYEYLHAPSGSRDKIAMREVSVYPFE